MQNEPVLSIASITALIAALIALGSAFGLPLSDAQTQAILTVVAVAGPIVAALFARGKVYSPGTHHDEIQRANKMGQGGYSYYPRQPDEKE